MNNADYFKLYSLILETINNKRPDTFPELIPELQKSEFLNDKLKNNDSKMLMSYTLEVVENLINDSLVKGKIISTKDGKFYMFDGLTTQGHRYLEVTKDKTKSEKTKDYLKENGISMTPESISKAIANLLW